MKRSVFRFVLAGLAAAVLSRTAVSATNTWSDTFEGTNFHTRWRVDAPKPAKGTVMLDTTNDVARFDAFAVINMWTLRDDAPILWTDSPAGNFAFETHAAMSTNQNYSQAGIVVYEVDGGIPKFILALDHWNAAARVVKFQGVGNNIPNVFVPATNGVAWLRLKVIRDAGRGGADHYAAQYKLNVGDAWTTLTTYDIDTANTRVGLVFKTNGGGRKAEFSYVTMTEIPTTFIDSFDEDELDVRWGNDSPDPTQGAVTLNTSSNTAHFESFANIDMWTARKNAPILWTPSPAGDFYVETHVSMGTAQLGATAGIVLYTGDGTLPAFILQLNQWTARIIHFQGLGDSVPNMSVAAAAGEAWLRLNVLRDGGAGGLDRYVAQYKQDAGDPWTILGVYDEDTPNARAGLTFKASADGKTADFSYTTVGELSGLGDGTVVKLDFSQPGDAAGGSLADWNRVPNAGGTFPGGKVIRHGDAAIVPGASVYFRNYQANKVDDNANCNDWPGMAADPYYILAADDIYWHGVADDFSTVFRVDPRLAYTVRIYSLISDNPTYVERFVVTDGSGTRSVQNTRGDRWGAATLESAGMVFTGLTANAAGELEVTVEDVTNKAYPLNAIVLEAEARAPAAPAVTNLGARDVMAATATLRGAIRAGAPLPRVTVYWWEVGGTTNDVALGEQWTAFSTNVDGLSLDTEYQYFCMASNALGVATSRVETFRTAVTGIVPVVTATATDITISSATIAGNVAAGDPSPTVTVCWGRPGAITNAFSLGRQGGAFACAVTGLVENTSYAYYCLASNLAGVVSSPTNVFTTDLSATIVYVGAVEGGEAVDWRTATTPKTMDIDWDNVYGSTLGAVHWGLVSVGRTSPGSAAFGWDLVRGGTPVKRVDYSMVNHITVAGSNTTAGIVVPDFDFELTGVLADYENKTVRVGIMHDVLSTGEWAGDTFKALRVSQLVGGAGDSGTIPLRGGAGGDGVVEMYFFDITHVKPGDRFAVDGINGVGGVSVSSGYVGVVSWDIIDNARLSPGLVLIVR